MCFINICINQKQIFCRCQECCVSPARHIRRTKRLPPASGAGRQEDRFARCSGDFRNPGHLCLAVSLLGQEQSLRGRISLLPTRNFRLQVRLRLAGLCQGSATSGSNFTTSYAGKSDWSNI